MGFLIDTGLWIAIERGRLSAADIHAITRQAPVYLSPVNLAEIRFGIGSMTDAKQKQRAMTMLRRMRRKPLVRIGAETAEVFGALSSETPARRRTRSLDPANRWAAVFSVTVRGRAAGIDHPRRAVPLRLGQGGPREGEPAQER